MPVPYCFCIKVSKTDNIRKNVGEIIRKLCEQKGVEIIEAEACKDRIHLLVSIPPHLSVSQFMDTSRGNAV